MNQAAGQATPDRSPAPPDRSPAADWPTHRGAPRDKLCVYLVVSLRRRIDRTWTVLAPPGGPRHHSVTRHRRAVAAEPALDLGGGVKSRNDLITLACHRLCTQAETGELPLRLEPHQHADRAAAPAYRMSWENIAERRCQLTVRLPMAISMRLRGLHRQLTAEPSNTRPADLALVETLSDLVSLACHRLCETVEHNPRTGPRR